MSTRKGRGWPRRVNSRQDIPPPEVPRDASGTQLQGTLEMQDTLAGILQAVDVLAAT